MDGRSATATCCSIIQPSRQALAFQTDHTTDPLSLPTRERGRPLEAVNTAGTPRTFPPRPRPPISSSYVRRLHLRHAFFLPKPRRGRLPWRKLSTKLEGRGFPTEGLEVLYPIQAIILISLPRSSFDTSTGSVDRSKYVARYNISTSREDIIATNNVHRRSPNLFSIREARFAGAQRLTTIGFGREIRKKQSVLAVPALLA